MKYENKQIDEKVENTNLVKYNEGNKNKEGLLQKLKNTTILKKLKSIKNIELIIAVVIVAIMLLIYASTLNKANETNTNLTSQNTTETRLQGILEEIKGAGKVKVMIYYESENEQNKSTASTIFGNKDTNTTTDKGKIKGVIIVAEGANNIAVRLSLIEATKTALAIEYSEIEIFKMKE